MSIFKKMMAEHAKAVTAMNTLFQLFPAGLRPDPNTPPDRRSARKTDWDVWLG